MRRRILGVLAAMAILTGCGNVATGAEPSTAPSGATSASPTPAIGEIPDAALLQKADLGDGEIVPEGPIINALSPCKTWDGRRVQDVPLPSEIKAGTRKSILMTYRFTDKREAGTNRKIADGFAYEVITAYPAGGAEAYLTELRDALNRCATVPLGETVKWEQVIVAEDIGGDDSLIWSRKISEVIGGGVFAQVELVAVLRIGDVVIVLHAWFNGNESVKRAHLERLASAALRRAAALSK